MSETLTISPEKETTDKLNRVALDHGIELSEDRLKGLNELVEKAKIGLGFHDEKTGVYISHGPEPDINFMPEGFESPTPEQATLFAHYGIRGIQDYTLLVEAGFIERPESIHGYTNPQIAKAVERLGFESGVKGGVDIVDAPFDTIEERVFSDEIKRLDEILVKRLASEKLGKTALSSSPKEL